MGQGQRGGVGLLELDPELAEDQVAVEAPEGIDHRPDAQLQLLEVEAVLGRVVAPALVGGPAEARDGPVQDEAEVGVHALRSLGGGGLRGLGRQGLQDVGDVLVVDGGFGLGKGGRGGGQKPEPQAQRRQVARVDGHVNPLSGRARMAARPPNVKCRG
ncbi:hypothetical protein D3C87_1494130 [compost metagenome]